jgi:hypothetical protein
LAKKTDTAKNKKFYADELKTTGGSWTGSWMDK